MTLRSILTCTTITLILGVAAPSIAADTAPTPAAYAQQTDVYAMPVGDLEIVSLSDGTVPQNLHKLLTGTTAAEVDDLLKDAFQVNPVDFH
ncbi:hypothetical protein ASG43_19080 [Aureimonas sp. Leaf454]|uniref:hypothetical protein n=1 Tax=Aureimonas sp. Leaf454 TaxID=1736381 RepID=UPI0006F80848|nr:hypothetical protein [Aureimonas sp. Leaf454]KQT53315.1 hypothetical protein ASG43_19080 [Aureimonas sp. Leaf454]